MKFLGAIALTSFFLLPNLVLAACVADNATVVYINGIFTTETQARNDAKNLSNEFIQNTGDRKTKFINGYNPSHLAGAGDLIQAGAQMMGKSISNFDRDTILLQIHPQVTTRKLVLVGHSQGAFYSNALYDYLLAHGEPKAAVGVYQVGSPASSVAGNGTYLNSSSDTVLGTLRDLGFKFLSNNINLVSSAGDAQGDYPGHSFSGAYLAEAPERVVGDIQGTLKNLKAEAATEVGECFTAPNAGLGYQATKAGFAMADTAALGLKTGAGAVQVAAVAAGNVLASAVQGAYGLAGKLATDIGITVGGAVGISHAAEPQSRTTNFDLFSKLYGSSLTRDEYKELLGSAVATAPVFTPEPAPQAASKEAQIIPEVQAPKKITYLSRSHRSSTTDNEPQEEVEAPAETVEVATTTEEVAPPADTATTTEPVVEPATTTPPVVPPPVPAFSVVFQDSFDAYNDKGWQTPGDIFSGSLIPFEPELAESGLCHSGSCIVGKGGLGGFGGGSSRPYISVGVAASPAGFLTVWAKRQDVWREVTANTILCITGTACAKQYWGDIPVPNDNEWHQYLFAWRTSAEGLQLCVQKDTLDIDACGWAPITGTDPAATFDTVGLTGMTLRSDLGDRIWFDDISVSLLQ